MSQRVTRSRGAKLIINEEEQSKIRDHFTVTRNRRNTVKKLVEVGAPIQTVVKNEPQAETHATEVTKRVKRDAEIFESSSTTATQSLKPVIPKRELTNIDIVPQSPPRRARKTPTPNSSPIAKVSNARKALFAVEEKEKLPESLVIETGPDIVACPVNTVEKKVAPKIRTVAQLQAALAEKGALRKIHEQNLGNKSREVDAHATLLKSPTKAVPRGKALGYVSPLKKATYIKRVGPPVVETVRTPEKLPAPEYVLPTYKTPAKQIDSDEERESDEKMRVFDYGKASRLIPIVKENSSIPLPTKYQNLLESFQSCDRILSIYVSQGRRCVVNEIQKNVEKNIKKEFNLKQLGQVVNVYPSSYIVKLEEQRHAFGGVTAGKYEHVISPDMVNDLNEYMLPDSPKKNAEVPLPLVTPGKCISPMKSPKKKCVAPLLRAPETGTRARLEGWRMSCRSHVMRHLLAEKVKKCYKAFMARIGAPEPKFPVQRFHPKFVVRIDSECADLEQAPLPEPPRRDENLKQMRDFMNSVDVEAKIPDVVNKAIQELKSPVKSLMSPSTNVPLSPRKFAQIQSSKPKGTMSLLERIRAKEAAKKLADSMKNPEVERKKALLQRLEQSMLRSVLCMYTQKQCRSLELNIVVEKILYNAGRTLTNADVKHHLELLCEIAPDYCSIKEVVSRKYLQISNPDFRLLGNIVKEELQKIAA